MCVAYAHICGSSKTIQRETPGTMRALDPEPELMHRHGARLPCSMLFVEIPEQLTGTA